MIRLVKLGLIVIAVLALMFLWGSGQLETFFEFCKTTLSSL